MHEHLLLKEPLRKPAAIQRTLNNFADNIVADTELGCWLWNGRTNPKGYGLISVGNHDWLTHRYAFGVFVGGHRTMQTLDHICRRRDCVRPDHLMPMTLKQNLAREHAGDLPTASVLADLMLIPSMSPETWTWANNRGLPVGRGNPDGSPFWYGLDAPEMEHEPGPATWPQIKQLSTR